MVVGGVGASDWPGCDVNRGPTQLTRHNSRLLAWLDPYGLTSYT